MQHFSATVTAGGPLAAPPEQVWLLLRDPPTIAACTPLLAGIDVDGDLWRWEMSRVGVPGFSFAPAFSERMTFDAPHRIEFRHDPPTGTDERTGAAGRFLLQATDAGTSLGIEVTVQVALPLPRTATAMVTRAMRTTMSSMGSSFTANLERRLAA